jgi:hypothetical protein
MSTITTAATDTVRVQAITMTYKVQRVGGQDLPTEGRGRQSSARGPLDVAVFEALSERLHDWALWPVVEEVLRRPPAGKRTAYVVKFSARWELVLVVEPVLSDGTILDDVDDTDEVELEAPAPPAAT